MNYKVLLTVVLFFMIINESSAINVDESYVVSTVMCYGKVLVNVRNTYDNQITNNDFTLNGCYQGEKFFECECKVNEETSIIFIPHKQNTYDITIQYQTKQLIEEKTDLDFIMNENNKVTKRYVNIKVDKGFSKIEFKLPEGLQIGFFIVIGVILLFIIIISYFVVTHLFKSDSYKLDSEIKQEEDEKEDIKKFLDNL